MSGKLLVVILVRFVCPVAVLLMLMFIISTRQHF